jgi:hypothetical protein
MRVAGGIFKGPDAAAVECTIVAGMLALHLFSFLVK